jgi:hypothetical protein
VEKALKQEAKHTEELMAETFSGPHARPRSNGRTLTHGPNQSEYREVGGKAGKD